MDWRGTGGATGSAEPRRPLYRRRPIPRFASHREQSVPFTLSNFEFHQPGTFPGAPAPGKCVPWCGRWWCSRLTRGMPTPQARQDILLSSFLSPLPQVRHTPESCTDGGRSPRFASHRASRAPNRSPTRSHRSRSPKEKRARAGQPTSPAKSPRALQPHVQRFFERMVFRSLVPSRHQSPNTAYSVEHLHLLSTIG